MARRALSRGAGVVALALVAAACAGSSSLDETAGDDAREEIPADDASDDALDAAAAVPDAAFEGDDFYAVPDPLPQGEPGTLLRFEPIDDAVAGAAAWRIMYLSETTSCRLRSASSCTTGCAAWARSSSAGSTTGGQDHVEAVPDAVSDGFEWIEQRFAGEEPVNTCSSP